MALYAEDTRDYHIAPMYAQRLAQALDELWRRRILRETADDSYEFTHERLREACCEGMSAARLRLTRRRVAEALEAKSVGPPGGDAGKLAAHCNQTSLSGR